MRCTWPLFTCPCFTLGRPEHLIPMGGKIPLNQKVADAGTRMERQLMQKPFKGVGSRSLCLGSDWVR